MPRNSRYRFEALLRVRRLQEDLKSQALAGVRRDIQRATRERDDLALQQRLMLEEAGKRTEQSFTAAEVGRYYQHERYLARLTVEKDALINQLRAREEHMLAELGEATKRKRIVERLSERGAEAYTAWMNKETQAITDETATNKAAVARIGKRA